MQQEIIIESLYNSIKNKDILGLHSLLEKDDDIINAYFWLKSFRAVVLKIEAAAAIDINGEINYNEAFWLDIQRAFIDTVPQ